MPDIKQHKENILAAGELGREFMLEILADYAGRLEKMPEEEKTEDNRVYGCANVVYISARKSDGKVYLRGEAESRLVSGQLYILLDVLSGKTAGEIKNLKPAINEFVSETGINSSLIPTRANTIGSIYKHILKRAEALTAEK